MSIRCIKILNLSNLKFSEFRNINRIKFLDENSNIIIVESHRYMEMKIKIKKFFSLIGENNKEIYSTCFSNGIVIIEKDKIGFLIK